MVSSYPWYRIWHFEMAGIVSSAFQVGDQAISKHLAPSYGRFHTWSWIVLMYTSTSIRSNTVIDQDETYYF